MDGDDVRHILVVDDDHRLRRLLQRYLSDHGYHVTAAASADEAKAEVRSFAFDLVVLDVMMPGQDGISLCEELREHPGLPVLLLTARGEIEDRVRGLTAGADDYLVKPFDPRELLLRIASVLRRAEPARPARGEIRFGPFCYDPEQPELRCDDLAVHLTEAEHSLLQVLVEEPGRAIGREELGRKSRISGTDRAIDTQIARLRRKIEPDPKQPRYLLTRRGEGYVLRTGP